MNAKRFAALALLAAAAAAAGPVQADTCDTVRGQDPAVMSGF